MNLLIDENVAFAGTAFSQFGNVKLVHGRKITNELLTNADILIVRSITQVDEFLLKGTPVKFVGTATIGTDHIDVNYLNSKNITFADAKGCNAYSVAEYVVAALLNLAVRFDFKLKNKSIGIVGVGNVGSKVADFFSALGMKVFLNDPPLKRMGDNRDFVEIDEILKCDIITIHTPLNLAGIDKTFHLFDNKVLSKLKNNTILINSARGAVIDNKALTNIIDKKNLKVVLDVWENEPGIDEHLLKKVILATPHIAGYSYEGKVNGTKMIYDALCKYLNQDKTYDFKPDSPEKNKIEFNYTDNIEVSLNNLITQIYSIKNDDIKMRKSSVMDLKERSEYFDLLRKNYPVRREFNNYTITAASISKNIKALLKKLRFEINWKQTDND